jgi:hypothetical protein
VFYDTSDTIVIWIRVRHAISLLVLLLLIYSR